MAVLWEEWLGCEEQWNKSEYAIRLTQTKSHEKIGCRLWMTRRQIIDKWHGDETIADAIIETKRSDKRLSATQIKPHPDAPHVEVTRLEN